MPPTDTKNPKEFTVMKAIILLITLCFGTLSFDLPNINSHLPNGGKCIKAGIISSPDVSSAAPPASLCHFPESDCKPHSGPEKFLGRDAHCCPPKTYRIRTVVIDPGHGGHDPGCLGQNSREKSIVLAIGKYLAEGLRAKYPDLKVIMTRSTDVFVPLHQRASLATESKADLFISIHCNAFSKPHISGTETYVLGLHATKENLEVAKRENEAILFEDNYRENYGYDPNSPEAHIVFSMIQNAFLEQSISFAQKVQKQAANHTRLANRGVKQAGFLVLRHATMPSVLVETGYLTNGNDEACLMTDQCQRAMADALLNAFAEYKREMENTDVAAVSYIEVKKTTPLPPVPHTTNTPVRGGKQQTVTTTSLRRVKTTEKSAVVSPQEEEVKKARQWGLEIAPPSNLPRKTTNVPPKRNSKIAPAIPVDDQPKDVIVEASSPRPVGKKERPAKTPPPASKDEVFFCVQLAASPTLLDVGRGKWNRIDQTVEVVREGSLYKYQIRNFQSLASANAVKKELRGKGFSDAFVVAYKNGRRVDPRKLR